MGLRVARGLFQVFKRLPQGRTSLFGALPSNRWCRPTHFNGAAAIMVFEMSSGLTCRST
jgi:hypothetical protein